jgi:flagellar hook-associated protein 2
MGSPITLSGFNSIDFNIVLNAVMQQESRPLQALQQRQQDLKASDGIYGSLAGKLTTLDAAATDLASSSRVLSMAATSSAPGNVAITGTGADAVEGRYDLVASQLAHAQVTASATTAPDADTTQVASGGSLTIGGATVTLAGGVTLRGLATAINQTTDSPALASIVQTAPGEFRLVLTARQTGASHAFTVANGLTGSTLAFTDTDNDGLAGNSQADNTVQATNASVLVNNLAVTSESNTLTTGIPGVSLALLNADAGTHVTIAVSRDDADLKSRVDKFISAFNDITAFVDSKTGTSDAVGTTSVLRGLRGRLRAVLGAASGTGAFTRLAEVGIGFTRTGELKLDKARLADALTSNPAAVASLFGDASTGVFGAISTVIDDYTKATGYIQSARNRLSSDLSRLSNQIQDMQDRLALRRTTLQREYSAADQAMTRLNAQMGSISGLAGRLSTSGL